MGCAIACVAFLRPLRGNNNNNGGGDGRGSPPLPDDDPAKRAWLSVAREG